MADSNDTSISGDKVGGSKIDIDFNVNPPKDDAKDNEHIIYQSRMMWIMYSELVGNGHPGLFTRVKGLEVEAADSRKSITIIRNTLWWFAGVLALVLIDIVYDWLILKAAVP